MATPAVEVTEPGSPIEGIALLNAHGLAKDDGHPQPWQFSAISGCFGRWPLGFRLITPACDAAAAVADGMQGNSVDHTLIPSLCKIDNGYTGFGWRWELRNSTGDVELSTFGDDPFRPPKGEVWRENGGFSQEVVDLVKFELTPIGVAHTDAMEIDGEMHLPVDPACVRVDGLPLLPKSSYKRLEHWLHVDGCPDEFQLHVATRDDGVFFRSPGYVTTWCGRRLHGRVIGDDFTRPCVITSSSVYLDEFPPWTARIHRQFPHLARAVVATVHLCNHRGALPAEGGARLPRLPSELLWAILERFTVFDMMPRVVFVQRPNTDDL